MQVLSSHLHQALVQHISVQCSQCRSIKDWQSRFPSQVEWKVMCAHDESHTAASASGIEVTRTSAHRQALSQEMNTKASSVCERCLCATYLARSFLSSLLPLAITNAAVLVHSKVGPLALADGSRATSISLQSQGGSMSRNQRAQNHTPTCLAKPCWMTKLSAPTHLSPGMVAACSTPVTWSVLGYS